MCPPIGSCALTLPECIKVKGLVELRVQLIEFKGCGGVASLVV